MKILLTGITGYLGSKLVRFFPDDEILGIYATPRIELPTWGNVSYIQASARNFKDAVLRFNPEVVINAAGLYDHNPLDEILAANLMFPIQLLEWVAGLSTRAWIQVGTSLPRDLSPYSLSKSHMADWGELFSRNDFLAFVNLNVEQFYGPRDGRFISFVLEKLMHHRKLELTLCTQRRDLIHVDDVCRAIQLIAHAEHKGFSSFPVGSGDAPVLREVVDYCSALIGSRSEIVYGAKEFRMNEPMFSVADTTSLVHLGFRLQYDWKQGMSNVIQEMKK